MQVLNHKRKGSRRYLVGGVGKECFGGEILEVMR